MNGIGRTLALGAALMAATATGTAAPAPDKVVSSLDLSKAFTTRTPWRFTATQGPEMPNPIIGGTAPGKISLCIRNGTRSCRPDLDHVLRYDEEDDFSVPHFMDEPRIVHPRGPSGRTLLLLRVMSLQSVNGGQRIGTMVLGYDRATDSFRQVYARTVGHNNNQEVRYIAQGPLKGAMIAVEETGDAPYGFWITVSRLTPAYSYRQVLRFRSATHYGDGNPLAVIDSDMANIQQRLGLWRPGKPLPLPAGGCARPRLKGMELWCN